MIRRHTSGSVDEAAVAGFSLLELLVSLALLAIMAATMSLAIGQLRPMQSFQQRLRETDVADAIVNVIARDLQSAVRLPLIEGGGTSDLVLRGEPQRIVFSAVVPTGFQRRGLREVTYEILGTASQIRLVRKATLRRLAIGPDGAKSQEEELWAGPMALQLSYLQKTEAGGEHWLDEFSAINAPPKAISIRLSIPGRRPVESSRIVLIK